MSRKALMAALALIAGLGLASGVAMAADPPAAPGPATPGGKAVIARQVHYKELNGAFRALNVELRKDAPDKTVLTASAGQMKDLVAALPGWFPKGSGPEAGVQTAAKAEIWTDAAGFAAVATGLQTETAKLAELATAGDLDGLKAQVRVEGGACKACHDKYREPEKH